MTRIPIEPYWNRVMLTFQSRKHEWIGDSGTPSAELSLWLESHYNTHIRGRKRICFVFETESDAEYFIMKFSSGDI